MLDTEKVVSVFGTLAGARNAEKHAMRVQGLENRVHELENHLSATQDVRPHQMTMRTLIEIHHKARAGTPLTYNETLIANQATDLAEEIIRTQLKTMPRKERKTWIKNFTHTLNQNTSFPSELNR